MEVLLNSMTYNLERFEKAQAPNYQRALAQMSDEGSIFHQVIDKYYGGYPDKRTLQMLGKI